jgi:hypothetical protein
MALNNNTKNQFEKIIESYENDPNPPEHIKTIKQILKLETEE